MELLNILKTHNRIWSNNEKICFTIILFIVTIILIYLLKNKKIIFSQSISILLLYIYLAFVYESTVFTRLTFSVRYYELEPLWSWKLAIAGSKYYFQEIMLNIILLFPVGFLTPLILNKKTKNTLALVIGIAISSSIELLQLFLKRGLFEFDDIINNTLGCVLGCVVGNIFFILVNKSKD